MRFFRYSTRNLFLGVMLGLVVLAGIFFWSHDSIWLRSQPAFRIGTHEFRIEVASTWEAQERGLGYRPDLCGDCGMLFVFATPGRYGFWMKGMEFPLDILWIRDSRIVSIEKNLSADDRRTLTPPSPADQVLEINAGLVDRYGISVGDQAERVR